MSTSILRFNVHASIHNHFMTVCCSNKDESISRLGRRCLLTWAVAVTIWLSDRLQCSLWLSLNFPYLHAIWHILVFISSYQACVLFAFFDTEAQYPELSAYVEYWPSDRCWWLGIALLKLRNAIPISPERRPCKVGW